MKKIGGGNRTREGRLYTPPPQHSSCLICSSGPWGSEFLQAHIS